MDAAACAAPAALISQPAGARPLLKLKAGCPVQTWPAASLAPSQSTQLQPQPCPPDFFTSSSPWCFGALPTRLLQEEALQQVQSILGCSTTTARALLIFFGWDAEAVLGGCQLRSVAVLPILLASCSLCCFRFMFLRRDAMRFNLQHLAQLCQALRMRPRSNQLRLSAPPHPA